MSESLLNQDKLDAFAQLRLLRQAIAFIAPEDQELRVVDELLDKLRARPYTVAVVGEFNRGKSSLINALLGMDILPSAVTPTTATINRLVYADVPYVKLHLRDGSTEDIPFTMLKARVTKLGKEAKAASAKVSDAEIGYPTVFCRNGVTILDTPGLNEAQDMSSLTLERASSADAVIYTLHALIPFSMTEAESLCTLLSSPSVKHILFTVGFMDQVLPEERSLVMDTISQRITEMTERLIDDDGSLSEEEKARRKGIIREGAVLGVSARKALNAFVTGSMEELSDSGIEPYKKELMRRLTVQQDAWFSQEISPYLKDAVARFDWAVKRVEGGLQQRIDIAGSQVKEAEEILDPFIDRRQTLIDQWRGSIWEVLCCMGDPTYSGSGNKLNAIDVCTSHLFGVIYAPVKNMSPYYPPKSGDGLLDRAKDAALRVAIDSGRFRVDNDPINAKLQVGFANAKEIVISDWLPALELMNYTYTQLREDIWALWESVLEKLRVAVAQVGLEKSVLPQVGSQPMQADWPLLRPDDVANIDVDLGDVTLGLLRDVARRGGYDLARSLCGQLDKRMSELANMLPEGDQLKKEGMESVGKIRAGIARLEEQKKKLESDAQFIRRLLLERTDTTLDPDAPSGV